VDQVDVGSSDRGFFELIREIKAKLSPDAKASFDVVSEYEMYPDDGEPEKRSACTDVVLSEIESAWFK